jgi:lactate dehydrogenase-like 2-hydroxyacid dehydrogenase
MLAALPQSLRYICHNGAGYDQVDVPACTAREIRVSNTPTAVDDATADIGIFLMLGALRNLAVSMASLRAGQWRGETLPALGHDPQGKVLGILGMGGIGRNFAKKALAFGMKIRYYNRTRLDESIEKEISAEYVDFDTLLRESDVLSLNLPLNVSYLFMPQLSHHYPNALSTATQFVSTPRLTLHQDQTRRIISRDQFNQMKQGVVVVNTARGAVMDEGALVEALNSGHVFSAGLDVYEEEPKVHPGLIDNPRVLLVPHMGTYTEETQTKMEEWTISNVRKALTEGKLRSIVPEQKHLG